MIKLVHTTLYLFSVDSYSLSSKGKKSVELIRAPEFKDQLTKSDTKGQSSPRGLDDSFQKMYSKELDLDEDEVPIILHELNDSAIHFISRE